jgi:hypothetical protein
MWNLVEQIRCASDALELLTLAHLAAVGHKLLTCKRNQLTAVQETRFCLPSERRSGAKLAIRCARYKVVDRSRITIYQPDNFGKLENRPYVNSLPIRAWQRQTALSDIIHCETNKTTQIAGLNLKLAGYPAGTMICASTRPGLMMSPSCRFGRANKSSSVS